MQKKFIEEFDHLDNKYGMGVREMLVLLKAYAQYKADAASGVPLQNRGWIRSPRALLPIFNRFGCEDVVIPTSYPGCVVKAGTPCFWENKAGTNEWRLTEEAIRFVDQNHNLFECAEHLLKVVVEPF